MNKRVLLRFIEGSATPGEQERVLEWIARSEANGRYFSRLKNLCVMQNLPQGRAEREDFEEFTRMFRPEEITRRRAKTPRRGQKLLVTAAVAAAAACVTFFMTLALSDRNINYTQTEPQLAYNTNRGVKGSVTLPDGSVVTLNSDSRISFPARFEGEYREVFFEGEGYFDVVANAQFPMRVSTPGDVCVEVKGTQFNLSSYPEDDQIRATLYNGEITVHSVDNGGRAIRTDVNPLETITIRKNSRYRNFAQLTVVEESDADRHTAWKRGELIFEDEPMAEVIKKLQRWHGVDFVVKDETVYSKNLTARFRSESIRQIMEMVHVAINADYSIEDNLVILTRKR